MDCREDLRALDICSVDPPGCTDIDDALHCRDLPNGNLEVLYINYPILNPSVSFYIQYGICSQSKFQVGVHIADVSHFIRPGTAIDKEAERRGTTVYLTDKVTGPRTSQLYLSILQEHF